MTPFLLLLPILLNFLLGNLQGKTLASKKLELFVSLATF
jgi:hypothetical protein